MGLLDAFDKDDRVEIKTTELFTILKEGAKCELIINAVNCNVPHRYIREMITGFSEKKEKI